MTTTQVQSGVWTADGQELLSQPLLNFFARRRIAISLIGFITLLLFNLLYLRTVPLNPFAPTLPWTALALCLLVAGLLIRSWAAGTLNKSREVTQQGPYSLTRNPLYIGSFLMMFGFCILLQDVLTCLFVAGPMFLLYRLQVLFEEKRLLFLFPEQWPAYTQQVPRFMPRVFSPTMFRGWKKSEWMRNREYKAPLATLAGLVAVYGWRVVSLNLW